MVLTKLSIQIRQNGNFEDLHKTEKKRSPIDKYSNTFKNIEITKTIKPRCQIYMEEKFDNQTPQYE